MIDLEATLPVRECEILYLNFTNISDPYREMQRSELFVFVLSVCIILISSFLPSGILLLLDYLIVRAVLVIVLLVMMNMGPTAGIFFLMAIAVLYLERNRRKVSLARDKLDELDVSQPTQAPVEVAYIPQKNVPVNTFDHAPILESDFLPDGIFTTADTLEVLPSGTGEFYPVDSSINQKDVLPTIYDSGSASVANGMYEDAGFGHIVGVETVGESHRL